jgi:DNA-binding MarR family transcriptional regulator
MRQAKAATVNKSARMKKRTTSSYVLDQQVGFILRQVIQRHTNIFTAHMGATVTQTQWAALVKLYQCGPLSQNQLGRLTAMDVATIKGVVDRLFQKKLVQRRGDESDARRHLISLTSAGYNQVARRLAAAAAITAETLEPLTATERKTIVRLLAKLV